MTSFYRITEIHRHAYNCIFIYNQNPQETFYYSYPHHNFNIYTVRLAYIDDISHIRYTRTQRILYIHRVHSHAHNILIHNCHPRNLHGKHSALCLLDIDKHYIKFAVWIYKACRYHLQFIYVYIVKITFYICKISIILCKDRGNKEGNRILRW